MRRNVNRNVFNWPIHGVAVCLRHDNNYARRLRQAVPFNDKGGNGYLCELNYRLGMTCHKPNIDAFAT